MILQALAAGQDVPPLKQFTAAVQRSAWRLLLFEGLISRVPTFTVSHRGRQHIAKHGCVVYPPLKTEANP